MKSRHALYCTSLNFSFLIFFFPSMLCGRRFVSYRPRHRNTGTLWLRIWKSSVLLETHSWFMHCVFANKPDNLDVDALGKNWTTAWHLTGQMSDHIVTWIKFQIRPGIGPCIGSLIRPRIRPRKFFTNANKVQIGENISDKGIEESYYWQHNGNI